MTVIIQTPGRQLNHPANPWPAHRLSLPVDLDLTIKEGTLSVTTLALILLAAIQNTRSIFHPAILYSV